MVQPGWQSRPFRERDGSSRRQLPAPARRTGRVLARQPASSERDSVVFVDARERLPSPPSLFPFSLSLIGSHTNRPLCRAAMLLSPVAMPERKL